MQYIIEEIENGFLVSYSMAKPINKDDDYHSWGKVYKVYFKKYDAVVKWIKGVDK